MKRPAERLSAQTGLCRRDAIDGPTFLMRDHESVFHSYPLLPTTTMGFALRVHRRSRGERCVYDVSRLTGAQILGARPRALEIQELEGPGLHRDFLDTSSSGRVRSLGFLCPFCSDI